MFFRRYKFSGPFYQADNKITNLAFAERIKPRNDLIIYATTESSVRSFHLIETPPPSAAISAVAAVATTVSSTITSTLRDRRPFHIGQHQQSIAHFTITDLEIGIGCTPGCAVLTQSELDGEQQFVIANSTGVFSYVGDDKRLALGIEGDKLAVHWWFNYLIIVTKENRKTPQNSSSISSNLSMLHKQQSNILTKLTAK